MKSDWERRCEVPFSSILRDLEARAIVITGSTSSGKTSTSRALQEALLPNVWTCFSMDTLIDGLPASVLNRCNHQDDWSGVDGSLLFRSSISCFRKLVEEGNRVIFDVVIPSEKRATEMLTGLDEIEFLSVYLSCGWEEIKNRTILRKDRTMSEAERSYHASKDHIDSALQIDSTGRCPTDLAQEIVEFIRDMETGGEAER